MTIKASHMSTLIQSREALAQEALRELREALIVARQASHEYDKENQDLVNERLAELTRILVQTHKTILRDCIAESDDEAEPAIVQAG